MKVLGIDPGSVNCGYAIIEVQGPRMTYLECGQLHAGAHLDKWRRIFIIATDLQVLMMEYAWAPGDMCGIESAYVPRGRTNGVETLAETRGALLFAAMSHVGTSVLTVAPSTVKKAVTGSGKADKDQVAAHVVRLLGLKVTPANDATDALAIAVAIARGAGK